MVFITFEVLPFSGNATPVISKNSDCDAANLWHMRLGHMSELGLADLNKRGLLDGYEPGKLKFCEHCISSTRG